MGPDETAALRVNMVEFQLRRRGIADESVLAAMAAVPRELFVPADQAGYAYTDQALPIDAGQTISQPYMVARMTELLEPIAGMSVLEVGTGSGYQTAVLAALGCSVVSIERHAELAETARSRLAKLGFGELVRVYVGDGSLGRPENAPFEGIVVTAAAPAVPGTLRGQLADGGRLVVPVGPRDWQQLVLVVRRGSDFLQTDRGPCIFLPLLGAEGFAPEAAEPRSWFRRLRH